MSPESSYFGTEQSGMAWVWQSITRPWLMWDATSPQRNLFLTSIRSKFLLKTNFVRAPLCDFGIGHTIADSKTGQNVWLANASPSCDTAQVGDQATSFANKPSVASRANLSCLYAESFSVISTVKNRFWENYKWYFHQTIAPSWLVNTLVSFNKLDTSVLTPSLCNYTSRFLHTYQYAAAMQKANIVTHADSGKRNTDVLMSVCRKLDRVDLTAITKVENFSSSRAQIKKETRCVGTQTADDALSSECQPSLPTVVSSCGSVAICCSSWVRSKSVVCQVSFGSTVHCSSVVSGHCRTDTQFVSRSKKKQRPSAKKRRRAKLKRYVGDNSSGQKSSSSDTISLTISSFSDDDVELCSETPFDCDLWDLFTQRNDPLHPINGQCAVMSDEEEEEEANLFDDRLKLVNDHWDAVYSESPVDDLFRRVHFSEDNLETVHYMSDWSAETYTSARRGPWETYTRDAYRFQRRINDTEQAIGYCFKPEHRTHMLRLLGAELIDQTAKS